MKKISYYIGRLFFKDIIEENINLRSIIENLPEYVYWKDQDFVYRGCNWNVVKNSGFRCPQDIVGKTDFDFSWTDERIQSLRADDCTILREGIELSKEEDILLETGKPSRIMLTRKSPLRDQAGKISGILGISTDITALKDLENQLREYSRRLEQDLRLVIEYLPEHIYWKDCNFIYRGCNKNVANYLNLSSSHAIIGKRDEDFGWSEERVRALREEDQLLLSSGQSVMYEEKIPMLGQPYREAIMLTHKTVLKNPEGKAVAILGVSVDITGRKRLEDDLKKSEAQADRLRILSSMGGMIAHEMRTPLTMMGFEMMTIRKSAAEALQLCESVSITEPLPQTVEAMAVLEAVRNQTAQIGAAASTISKSLAQIHHTIDTILIGFKEGETVATQFVPLVVDQLFQNLLSQYPLSEEEADRIRIIPAPGVTVMSNESVVLHIFTNFLKNALYHIKEMHKGEITIWAEQEAERVHLYFKDTAKGMPLDRVAKIFEPFYTTKSAATSIGMGLYFCKLATEKIRGQISCEAKDGHFTLFTLTLPVKMI